ncbi:MAG: hypothetical protein Q9169_005562 [Polycauliona sp. 2 TL-2023]
MEPVSVSIGAVGLISLLTTCIECFEYIDAANSCGRDLELLTTKFSIEKARLLIWGESVGILSSINTTACTRVEAPHVRPVIEQILNCIRMLFEDTNGMTARYGLRPANDHTPLPTLALAGLSESTQSVGLPLRLKVSYIQFKSRIKQNHRPTSTSQKTRWAIRDKQKFVGFVEDIHQFINGLEAITDSVEMATKRAALVREKLSTVQDPQVLSLIAEASAQTNYQWSEAASVALGASICGASTDRRIGEWMSEISDVRMSTTARNTGSEPSGDVPEPSSPAYDMTRNTSHKRGVSSAYPGTLDGVPLPAVDVLEASSTTYDKTWDTCYDSGESSAHVQALHGRLDHLLVEAAGDQAQNMFEIFHQMHDRFVRAERGE